MALTAEQVQALEGMAQRLAVVEGRLDQHDRALQDLGTQGVQLRTELGAVQRQPGGSGSSSSLLDPRMLDKPGKFSGSQSE